MNIFSLTFRHLLFRLRIESNILFFKLEIIFLGFEYFDVSPRVGNEKNKTGGSEFFPTVMVRA
jgi:hypothetical protein